MEKGNKYSETVNIASGLWSANAAFDDDHNIYMKDEHITSQGDDGGYNHFELRNYARQYKLEENNQTVFKIGDKNPAMEEAEIWLSDLLRKP